MYTIKCCPVAFDLLAKHFPYEKPEMYTHMPRIKGNKMYSRAVFLSALTHAGYITIINNCLYHINSLPDNLTINRSEFSQYGYTDVIHKLPDNLTIIGDLNITHCEHLRTLPLGLNVSGKIIVSEGQFRDIPEYLKHKIETKSLYKFLFED